MTPEEKQEIVQAVIAALKTNGRTIMQLTEATSISNSDYFEINGGRRIAYSKLYDNIMDDLSDTIEDFETDVNTAIAGKLNGYNASWIWSSSLRTEARFNEFVAAVQAHKVIYDGTSGLILNATYNPLESSIFIWYYNYDSSQIECTLTLSNGSVTLSRNTVTTFATVSAMNTLAGRVTDVESVTNNLTGENGATFIGYHNTDSPELAEADTVAEALDVLVHRGKEVYCTMEEYQEYVDSGTIDPDTKYYIYEE